MSKSHYTNLNNEFQVIQQEWDTFWSWMWFNTGCHHIGPLVTRNYEGKMKQNVNERNMLFFLTHKSKILSKTPTDAEKNTICKLCNQLR